MILCVFDCERTLVLIIQAFLIMQDFFMRDLEKAYVNNITIKFSTYIYIYINDPNNCYKRKKLRKVLKKPKKKEINSVI